MWEAMHGTMSGYYEIRTTGAPNRTHYRLFCLLDNGSAQQLSARGFDRPQIAVIAGMSKRNATLFTDREYKKHVRTRGDRYLKTVPRPISQD
jgi:hypothetical protein